MARPSAVTLRQLRAFVAVAEEGSIARAAKRFPLTPSALSMLIAALEAELGVRLFERTTRRLEHTEACVQLLPVARQVLARLDGTVQDLRATVQRRGTRLRIASSPLLAATLLPRLMAGFHERWPDIELTLTDLAPEEVAQAVRDDLADIGVRTADSTALDLLAEPLLRDPLVLACPVSHPLAEHRSVRWSALQGERLALMRPGSGLRALAEQGLRSVGDPAPPAFEVAHVTTAVGLVEAGLALTVLPRYALTRARAQGVRGVPLIDPVVERDIVALSSPSRPLAPAGQAFVAHFRQALQDTDPDIAAPPLRKARKPRG